MEWRNLNHHWLAGHSTEVRAAGLLRSALAQNTVSRAPPITDAADETTVSGMSTVNSQSCRSSVTLGETEPEANSDIPTTLEAPRSQPLGFWNGLFTRLSRCVITEVCGVHLCRRAPCNATGGCTQELGCHFPCRIAVPLSLQHPIHTHGVTTHTRGLPAVQRR